MLLGNVKGDVMEWKDVLGAYDTFALVSSINCLVQHSLYNLFLIDSGLEHVISFDQ